MDDQREFLQRQAAKCRRLARDNPDAKASAALLALAADYDARRAALDREPSKSEEA